MAKEPLVLPVGEWLPDYPDLNNPGSPNVRNVIARTEASYGPSGGPSVYSNALDNRCQGSAAFIDASGNVNLFAGTSDKLYHMVSGSTSWVDVSKVGGYNCPSNVEWQFEYYNGYVTATDFADNIQVFQLGVSTKFGDLAAAAPRAYYSAMIKGFLAVANTYDGVSAAQPQRVWWPSAGDPTTWPTPGSVSAAQLQSSYNDLFGSMGWIQGIVGNLGSADGAVFMERGVWRMNYAGPPVVFDFLPAEGVRGCLAPYSIVQYGNLAYYLGEDGFYSFDGTSSTPIGANKIDKTFFADLDVSNISRVKGVADPINKQILWAYPGSGNSNGNPNHILAYNWYLQRWTILDVTCETIARLLTIGYTLDQLFTVLGYTLDTLPAPLDSRLWTGGALLLGMFDTSHKLNFFTGSNLAPTVDTKEMQPFPGRFTKVTNTRPLVDGGVPSVAMGTRNRLVDKTMFTAPSAMNALGSCGLRTNARYQRGRITLPAGSTFSNIQGLELEATRGGSR